jgi:hypothetical protein
MYSQFTERAHVGDDLVRAIPESEPQVLVLCDEDRPLLPFFRPYWLGRDVILIKAHSPPSKIDEQGINYIVVGGGALGYYPELCQYLQTQTNVFEPVMTRFYISKFSDGPEKWTLYRRIGRPRPRPN